MAENRKLLALPSTAYPAAAEPGKVALYTPEFYLLCSVGGIASCGLTHTLTTPLDLVKCRMQTGFPYKGPIDGFKQIVSGEGAKMLTLGWGPTLVGYSFQGLCKFGFYEYFKKKFADIAGEEVAFKYRTFLYLAASASAEVIADVALCPWEAIKVRIQTSKPGDLYAKGIIDGLPKLYNTEGLHGLYKGVVPLWTRQIPYTMMKFAAFERTVEAIYKYALSKPKDQYNKAQQLGVSFVAGYIAGVFCAVVSHPADVVVSKLNKSAEKTMGQIVKELGFWGCWSGLGPRIFMIGTLTALQWFIYDSFKAGVGLPTTGAVKKVEVVTPAPTATKQ